ncbi:Glu-tRNA(Gln) amidotransferase subunit GatE [Candidatus Woesearchaeota archaeon]|nr:Glu-tRNA(Gln) amidotransferase subunit GatE [Candidatus Woesearchaeota archaeon]
MIDYKKLGFKAGIEIHQQLPGKKLFCGCPAEITDAKPDAIIIRELRASAGESGSIDQAAAHEQKKAKQFEYYVYNDNTCLVELDEEPPHQVNQEALKTVMQITQLLNAKPVQKIQFMRKTVIDGSNVSGFQRTALVGRDGHIETSKGRVRISVICLEEEAAKIVKRSSQKDTYNLSRLGIPLIEIATEPDIIDSEHAKETAEKIGMILRSTQRVKRGLGSIRQDVNLSINNGARVEIKGFQEIKNMPKVIEIEIQRHVKLKGKLKDEVRKVESNNTTSYLRPMPGADRMYPETDVAIITPTYEKLEGIELIEDTAKRLAKTGISKDLAELIAKQHLTKTFEAFTKKFKKLKPSFIGETMLPKLRELTRKHNVDANNVTTKDFETIFEKLNNGQIAKDALEEILITIAKKQNVNYQKYSLMTDKELENKIKNIISKNKGLPFNALIGKAMGELRGKADGKKIVETLKKHS